MIAVYKYGCDGVDAELVLWKKFKQQKQIEMIKIAQSLCYYKDDRKIIKMLRLWQQFGNMRSNSEDNLNKNSTFISQNHAKQGVKLYVFMFVLWSGNKL